MRTDTRCAILTQLPVAFCAGMTENSAVATYNPVGNVKLGTVGVPYPGIGFRSDPETGEIGAAAACAVMIAAASTVVTLLFLLLGRVVDARTQAWRAPAGR